MTVIINIIILNVLYSFRLSVLKIKGCGMKDGEMFQCFMMENIHYYCHLLVSILCAANTNGTLLHPLTFLLLWPGRELSFSLFQVCHAPL